jgi:glutamate dehydrogenase
MDLKQQLLASKVFPPERIQEDLIAYFPKQVVDKFRPEILVHPLAQEIALTMLTNRIIADCGSAWIAETTAMTGRTTTEVLEAYFKASELLGATSLKQHMDEIQLQLNAETEYSLRLQIEDAVAQVAEWILTNASGVNSKLERAIQLGLEHPETWMKTDQEHDVERKIETWMTQHLDRSMAQRLAAYGDIQELLDAAWLSSEIGVALDACTSALDYVGQYTGLQAYLHEGVRGVSSELDRPAQISLKRRVRRYLLEMTSYELSHQDMGALKPSKSLDTLRAEMMAMLGHAADHDLACMVVVADRVERHVRRMRHAV